MRQKEESVILLHEGDETAFKTIYERYFQALCIFSRQYVDDGQIAADLTQDAFVALWRKRRSFSSESSLRAFLYITVRNLSINHLKHEGIKNRSLTSLNNEMLYDRELRGIISTEVERQLIASVDRLPRECRNVLKMSIEGKSYREIGEILDIAISTVRNHRIRAIKILKSRFTKIS